MDWSKAKTILIVALLIANGILGYFVYKDTLVSNASAQLYSDLEVEELLSRRDITLNSIIPKNPETLLSMTVEFEQNEPFDINSRYFDGKGIRELGGEGIEEIYRGNEAVTIENRKLLIYENKNRIISVVKDVTIDDADETAKKFLQDRGYSTKDMKLTYHEENQQGIRLEYSKVLEDSYVEIGYTSFLIAGETVKRMERMWLNTVELQQSDLTLVPATKGILELLSIEQAHGKTITDISLCYYFDPEKQTNYEGFQQATQGNAVPGWRIQFEDGTKLVLDSE